MIRSSGRCLLTLLTLFAATAAPTHAKADGPFGLGIVLGEPTGLSAKWFVNPRHAFQLGVDFSFVDDSVYLGLDYLRHFPNIFNSRTVLGYVGIGGSISVFDNHDHKHKHDHDHDGAGRLKLRVPFGLAWMPRDPSIDVFIELVPLVRIVPDLEPGLAAGIGVRYWF